MLQVENGQDVEGGQADAHEQRDVKKQVERDGGADDFRQVAGRDGDLTADPEQDACPARVVIAARLRQVALGHDAEPRRQRLQQDGHEVRHHEDENQLVGEARAAGNVRGPVAGVHVADRDQEPGPGKRQQLAPEARAGGNADSAVDLCQ